MKPETHAGISCLDCASSADVVVVAFADAVVLGCKTMVESDMSAIGFNADEDVEDC